MAARRRRPGVRRRDTALPLEEVATAVEKVAAAAVVEEEATGEDVTDLDPGSAIATATATAIGTEEDEGAAPIDGKETALRAMGTAAEEEVEAEETGGTSSIVQEASQVANW